MRYLDLRVAIAFPGQPFSSVLQVTQLLKNFQEEISVKLTRLAVLALIVLGCSSAFAASGSFALGFQSYDQSIQYCDYEVVSFSDPFVGGTHVYTTGCGFGYDAVMVGLKATIPPATGQPTTGAGYSLADNSFDAIYGFNTGCQMDWFTHSKASTKGQKNQGKFGWTIYYSCGGGGEYLLNYGFLTTHLGPAKVGLPGGKTSLGNHANALIHKR